MLYNLLSYKFLCAKLGHNYGFFACFHIYLGRTTVLLSINNQDEEMYKFKKS